MLMQEVCLKYHKKVPVPFSAKKIRDAGYNITDFLVAFTNDIKKTSDFDPKDKDIILLLKGTDELHEEKKRRKNLQKLKKELERKEE